MPTAESVFPKIGNDPLYASEVNRFSPKLIGYTSDNTRLNGSGTTYVPLGTTISYSGTVGSIQISQFMIVETNINIPYAASHTLNSQLRISGTAGLNMVMSNKQDAATQGGLHHKYIHVLTSGVITSSGGNIGSNYVISREVQTEENNPNVILNDFVVWGH